MLKIAVGLPAYKGVICAGHAKMWRAFGAAVSKNAPNVSLDAFFDVDVCGIDHARNLILDTCKAGGSDWVIMVDSDTWVDRGSMLLSMVLEANERGATLVGAPVIMKDERTPNVFMYANMPDGLRLRPYHVPQMSEMFDVDGMGGAVIAIDLRKIGDMKFRFSDGTGEDLDFCHRLKKSGHKIVCDPRVKTFHVNKPNILTFEGTTDEDRYRLTSLRG